MNPRFQVRLVLVAGVFVFLGIQEAGALFTATVTPTISPTRTVTKTRTISRTFSPTKTVTPTFTITPTVTMTDTQTWTRTATSTFSRTPTISATFTVTMTPTSSTAAKIYFITDRDGSYQVWSILSDGSQLTQITNDGYDHRALAAGGVEILGKPTFRNDYSAIADTYTAVANGSPVTLSTPMKYFGIQLTGTGASATTWNVKLDGSLNGVTYTQLIQHTQADGDGATKWLASASPILYMRSRVSSLNLGGATNVVVTAVGVQ